mgnify:CR=1 FL=1
MYSCYLIFLNILENILLVLVFHSDTLEIIQFLLKKYRFQANF